MCFSNFLINMCITICIIEYAYLCNITSNIIMINLFIMHIEPEAGFILLLIELKYSFQKFVFFQITTDPVNGLIVILSINMSINCSALERNENLAS